MHKFLPLRFFLIAISSRLLLSCGPSFPTIHLDPTFPFSTQQTIGVYVIPSDQPERDRDFHRVLQLDLLTRGYGVIDVNKILDSANAQPHLTNHQEVVASLRSSGRFVGIGVVAVAKCIWDTVFVPFDLNIQDKALVREYRWRELHSLRLRSEIGLYDMSTGRALLSGSFVDSQYVYVDAATQQPTLGEAPWMIAGIQIRKLTEALPIAAEEPPPAQHRFSAVVYVDNSYREKFGSEWSMRLRRRLLYANDILRREFDMEIETREFLSFDAGKNQNLELAFERLVAVQRSNPNELRILFTIDPTLQTNWQQRSFLGLANPLAGDLAITAQPSLPRMAGWNSVEEALTIVHEVGHLFGALHSSSRKSLMFSESGSVSHTFDPMNTRIMELMRSQLYKSSRDTAIRSYISLLIKMQNTSPKNSVNILEPATRAALRLQPSAFFGGTDTNGLSRRLTSLIVDPAVCEAVQGFIAYRMENMKAALPLLESAVRRAPDFAEAHWYLSLVHARLGNVDLSQRHKKKSEELRPPQMEGV